MTIVDSINKITESLGGDTSGVQTVSEAINALGPVISGGGGGGGLKTVNIKADVHYTSSGSSLIPKWTVTEVDTGDATSFEEAAASEYGQIDETVILSIESYNYSSEEEPELKKLVILALHHISAYDGEDGDGEPIKGVEGITPLETYAGYFSIDMTRFRGVDGNWREWTFTG